jgi:hypothetical protein
MAKQKSKPVGLTNDELRDILAHMTEKMANALYDAMALTDDPQQRAQMATNTAMAVFKAALEVVIAGFEADKGRRPNRDAVIAAMMRCCVAFADERVKK